MSDSLKKYDDDLKSTINSIFENILESQDIETMDNYFSLFETLKNNNTTDLTDPNNWDHYINYNLSKITKCLVTDMNNPLPEHQYSITFLFQHVSFVQHHYEQYLEKIDGVACNADKSRFIIRSLSNFFITGEKIKINYDQEYTYHLPRNVFSTHDDILNFFNTLKILHSGNVMPYNQYIADNIIPLLKNTRDES